LGYSTSHSHTNIDTSGLSWTPLNESNTGKPSRIEAREAAGGLFCAYFLGSGAAIQRSDKAINALKTAVSVKANNKAPLNAL